MRTKKNLKYYLGLNWSYTIEQSLHKGKKLYIIRVNELPGVSTDATSIEKGMKEIQDIIAAAIELHLEQGDYIPEPVVRRYFPKKKHNKETIQAIQDTKDCKTTRCKSLKEF